MYSDTLAKLAALLVFVGFNLTFFPQFILGYLGMPRRYHMYPPEWQALNAMSSLGATVLAVGYLLPMAYFSWSLFKGERAGANPWHATGLEWKTQSPPLAGELPLTPVVTEGAYEVLEAGDQSCLTGWPRTPTSMGTRTPIIRRTSTSSRRWSSSSRRRPSGCGCSLSPR